MGMHMEHNYMASVRSEVGKELSQKNAPKTGTTIMAVAYGTKENGGVVLGADTRVSTGSYVASRVQNKIDKVHDKIFCMRSGSSADTQAIADIVKYYLDIQS